ncbi:unnamed protein product [Staurois parvus]|uniref:Secreted protein n=1 Tax=Staurois parvus TaxID=386267 RepID=A0ABN9FVD1_9NEOB|nr:unnamed protein product [Staurois parvus]
MLKLVGGVFILFWKAAGPLTSFCTVLIGPVLITCTPHERNTSLAINTKQSMCRCLHTIYLSRR